MFPYPELPRARSAFAEFHDRSVPADDSALDASIGLRVAEVESGLELSRLLVEHGDHRLAFGDLGYDHIRAIYRLIGPEVSGPILDLGCGYGRMGFYGGILFGFQYKGIDIIQERVCEARRAAKSLGLGSVQFESGDACRSPWPDSPLILLMNSFGSVDRGIVLDRLREDARSRPLVIASISTINLILETSPWLRELPRGAERARSRLDVRLFASF